MDTSPTPHPSARLPHATGATGWHSHPASGPPWDQGSEEFRAWGTHRSPNLLGRMGPEHPLLPVGALASAVTLPAPPESGAGKTPRESQPPSLKTQQLGLGRGPMWASHSPCLLPRGWGRAGIGCPGGAGSAEHSQASSPRTPRPSFGEVQTPTGPPPRHTPSEHVLRLRASSQHLLSRCC